MSFSFRIFRVALLFICQGSSFSFLLSFSSLFILPQPLSLVNYFFYLFSLSAGLCFCFFAACLSDVFYSITSKYSCQLLFSIFLFLYKISATATFITILRAHLEARWRSIFLSYRKMRIQNPLKQKAQLFAD